MSDEPLSEQELEAMITGLKPVDCHDSARDEQYLGCAECGWPRGEHASRCSHPVRACLITEVKRLRRLVREAHPYG